MAGDRERTWVLHVDLDQFIAAVEMLRRPELAAAVEVVATELDSDRMPTAAQPALVAVGLATGEVDRTDDLSGEVVLAQIRSVIADLLLLTGMDPIEATDALPPVRR